MSSSFLPPCHFNIFPFLLFLGDTHCLFILLVQHLDCTLAHCRRTKRKRNIEIASPYPVHPSHNMHPVLSLESQDGVSLEEKFSRAFIFFQNPPVFCHHFPCPLQAVSWPCPCLDTIPYHTIPYLTNMSLPRHSRAHIFWSPPHFPPRHHHHHHMPKKIIFLVFLLPVVAFVLTSKSTKHTLFAISVFLVCCFKIYWYNAFNDVLSRSGS